MLLIHHLKQKCLFLVNQGLFEESFPIKLIVVWFKGESVLLGNTSEMPL